MKCEICGHQTIPIKDKQFDLIYHSCDHCKFIAQDRGMLVSFEDERQEYDYHNNSIEDEGYVNYFRKFIETSLLPYVEGNKGLDYGSGPEPVLATLLERDYKMEMTIYDLHYQPEKRHEGEMYDFITSTEVIEHVTDPLSMLQTFYEHLKPGGITSIMTLFHKDNQDQFLDWWYRRDITHISFFMKRTFEVMAERIGFELVQCDDRRMVTLKKR